jgi:hypothetical protein
MIGPSTLALLRAAGVMTARHLFERGPEGYREIPGVGRGKWAVLLDWMWDALSITDRREQLRQGGKLPFDCHLLCMRGDLSEVERAELSALVAGNDPVATRRFVSAWLDQFAPGSSRAKR